MRITRPRARALLTLLALPVMILLSVVVFAAVSRADTTTTAAPVECTDILIDSADALTPEQEQDVATYIAGAIDRTGADIYVRVLPRAPYDIASPFSKLVDNTSKDWWRDEISHCPNWTEDSGSTKDNLIVMYVGATDDFVNIGFGTAYLKTDIDDLIYKDMQPVLEGGGSVADGIKAGLDALPTKHHASNITFLMIGGLILSVMILAVMWIVNISWEEKSRPKPGNENPILNAYDESARKARREAMEKARAEKERAAREERVRREKLARTVSNVHAAAQQLEDEWLAYETDAEAYYLTKPMLRDTSDPTIREYHDMMYALRDLVRDLHHESPESTINAADEHADKTLKAWDVANRHALSVGTDPLSHVERAALRRLHGMISQLSDRSTPRAMFNNILDRMQTEVGKLVRTPVKWSSVEQLPAIKQNVEVLELVQGRA